MQLDVLKMLGYEKWQKDRISKNCQQLSERLVKKDKQLKKNSVKISNVEEGRRRFAALAQDRRHEANAAHEAATSKVLTVSEEIKHSREKVFHTVDDAEVTIKNTIFAEYSFQSARVKGMKDKH